MSSTGPGQTLPSSHGGRYQSDDDGRSSRAQNSSNAGYYFQTSEAIAASDRKAGKSKNKSGNPIHVPSKILSVQSDPFDSRAIYITEAAGQVKRIVLETGEKISVDKATAPLTSLAISANGSRLFSGCWDKNIYSTDFESGAAQRFSGHTDFVKCVLATTLNGRPILISGGADAAIIVWDVDSARQLYKLKGHTKALQDLAVDPLSLPEGASEAKDSFVLFSASSDREIRMWHIGLEAGFELPQSIEKPICAHETSVYKIRFDSEGDLWTASADKTAKHLVRQRDWAADTVLPHPDFVRDVVVAEDLGMVVTACRDEEVRLWDVSSGDLLCVYSGHFEEVTGLVLVGKSVVSVSIDATVRRWSLERGDIARYLQERREEEQGQQSAEGSGPPDSGMQLTAEEEAELAELMNE